MANGTALKLLVVVDAVWCVAGDSHLKRVATRHQIPLSDRRSLITISATDVTLKFRGKNGRLCFDRDARLLVTV
jgi:hypothetical protein